MGFWCMSFIRFLMLDLGISSFVSLLMEPTRGGLLTMIHKLVGGLLQLKKWTHVFKLSVSMLCN
jgi:hypothetical protein